MNERVDPETGEITNLPATVDTTMATAIAKAELDTRITTARAYPRSIQTSVENILSLSTVNEHMAQDCIYALPRAGKSIRGPSIRLAEIIAQCWGNCVSESRVVAVDRVNKIITAEGIFHDLQTNATAKSTVERRISDKKGRLFSDDMIATTGNAARSIARRNAILSGVPKAVWSQAYDRCEKVIAGDITTLSVNRDKAVKAFAVFGLKPEQVYRLIDVKGEQDIALEDIITLRGMFASIKNGEATVEELLSEATRSSTSFDRVANPLQDNVAQSKAPAPAAAEQPAPQKPEQPQPAQQAAQPAQGELPTETPIEGAHRRGKEAKAAGHSRKAVPGEFRAAERSAEATAWLAGFDSAQMPTGEKQQEAKTTKQT